MGTVRQELERLSLILKEGEEHDITPGSVVDLNTFCEPWLSSVRTWGTTLPHALGTVINVEGNEADVHWTSVNPQASELVSVGQITRHTLASLVRVEETADEAW